MGFMGWTFGHIIGSKITDSFELSNQLLVSNRNIIYPGLGHETYT